MKYLALLFALVSASVATATEVTLASATSVLVDGVDIGRPCDAIANNRALASQIQIALEEWSAAQAAVQNGLRSKALADLAAADERAAAQLAAQTAARAKAEADLATLQEQIKATLDSQMVQLRAAYEDEILTGNGPKAQALQAQIDLIEGLLTAAGKSPAQLKVEAAQAAADKAAADLRAAKAALNQ